MIDKTRLVRLHNDLIYYEETAKTNKLNEPQLFQYYQGKFDAYSIVNHRIQKLICILLEEEDTTKCVKQLK
jgi:hypothetical protein